MSGRRGARERTLTVEIAAERESVWRALAGELNVRGSHVELQEHTPPEHLRLLLRPRGEVQSLDYRLEPLAGDGTAVTATVRTSGSFYLLKRLLTFGRIDEEYLRGVAVGLANLQRYLEEADEADEGEGTGARSAVLDQERLDKPRTDEEG